jgi:hypothetical protein
LTSSTFGEIDPDVVAAYLQQLSAEELVATLQPVRGLLPVEGDVQDVASPFAAAEEAAAAAAGEAAMDISAASAASTPVAAESSPILSAGSSSLVPSSLSLSLRPPLSLDSCFVRSWSAMQLSVAWSRCVSRSHWRRSVPSELLQSCFALLDVRSLLATAAAVSRHWRSNALELANASPSWRAAIAARRAQKARQCKMRVYRRLTQEDLHLQQQFMQSGGSEDELDQMRDT